MLKKGDKIILYFSQGIRSKVRLPRCIATVTRVGTRWATVDQSTDRGPNNNWVALNQDPATDLELAEARAQIEEQREQRKRDIADQKAYDAREDVQLWRRLGSVQWEEKPIELLRRVAAILDGE
jgi:hypothetical protein